MSPNIDNSVFLKFGDDGVVHSVVCTTSSNGDKHTKVELRIVHSQTEGRPEGDHRPGRPRPIDKGWGPDLLINPLCMPSRMTLTYPMYGFYATSIGRQVCGNAFTYDDIKSLFTREDENRGHWNPSMPINSLITCGPVYMQALKHHVLDKMQSRGYGSTLATSCKPIKGKSVNGSRRWRGTPCWRTEPATASGRGS